MTTERRYPIGIQTFSEIITRGCVYVDKTDLILELKTTDSAIKALSQINEKGYALPYQTEGRNIVKAGIHFNIEKRTIDEWVIEKG